MEEAWTRPLFVSLWPRLQKQIYRVGLMLPKSWFRLVATLILRGQSGQNKELVLGQVISHFFLSVLLAFSDAEALLSN